MTRHLKFFKVEKGITRRVFLVGSFAFKFPRLIYNWKNGLTGIIANIQEEELYSLHDNFFLCPLIYTAPFGLFSVMLRTRDVTEGEFQTYYDTIDDISLSYPVVERKPSSFGWYKGRIVAVDYG